jgi:3-methyladenine DNA glycosylase/8-oxoguanine DNA glycosylase
MRTPEGPATLHLVHEGEVVRAEAWGAGADRALDRAPALIGEEDDPSGFEPRHAIVADLWRRHRGVRLAKAGAILPVLVPAILEQKVTGIEARRAWRRMVRATGDPAPGPADLLLPPDPERLATLPYFAFHPWGVERRRAEVIRAVAARASWLEGCTGLPLGTARERLGSLTGIGPWTVAEVSRLALGDPDAVSVADYHLPNLVAWALAGETRGTDERMLQLLEPYRGHRARVQTLLEAARVRPPAFGPRREPATIDGL